MSNPITQKIREKHGTMTHYARKRGLSYRNLIAVINGTVKGQGEKSGQVVSTLKKDGLWSEPTHTLKRVPVEEVKKKHR